MDDVDATVVHSLKKVAKGGVIVVFATAIASILRFFYKVLLARSVPVSDYGAFSLGLALYGVLATVIAFGLPSGVPRIIAEWRTKHKDVSILAATALVLVLVFGIIASLVSVVFLSYLAALLNVSQSILLPFVISAVFIAVVRVANSIARGYEDAIARSLFGGYFTERSS